MESSYWDPHLESRRCLYCNEIFDPKTPWHMYCSEECERNAENERPSATAIGPYD